MSFYSNYQILYGNHSLSNRRYQVTDLDFRSSSPFELQSQPKPTVIGSVITRQRIGAKTITVKGGDTDQSEATSSGSNITDDYSENRYTRLNQIFTQQQSYLRTCPNNKVVVVDNCQAIIGWSNSGDGGALTLDTSDFQYINASLTSNITVSTGVSNFSKTLTSPINLSSLTAEKNLEGWVYLSDTRYFEGLKLKLGQDTNNFYSNVNLNYFKVKDDFSNAEWLKSGVTVTKKTISFPGAGTSERVEQEIAGAEYTGFAGDISIKVRAKVASGTFNFRTKIDEAFGTGAGTDFEAHTATTEWQWFSHTFTVNGTGSAIYSGIQQEDSGTPNIGVLIVDEIRLEYNQLTEYVENRLVSNYENKAIQNGWNYISIPLDRAMEYGTVDDTTIDYIECDVYTSTSQEDFVFKMDGWQVVDDNYTRNYLSFASSEVKNNQEWTQTHSGFFEVNLLNYRGYSTWTHQREVSLDYEISTTSSETKVNLQGNFEPLTTNTFFFNSATNVSDLRFQNLNTGETISWGRTWEAEDQLVFDQVTTSVLTNGEPQDFNGKLPKNNVGINYYRTQVVTSNVVEITQESTGNTDITFSATGAYSSRAQSFQATQTGTLTSIEVYIKTGAYVSIYANSGGGLPDGSNILFNGFPSQGLVFASSSNYEWKTVPINISITSSVTYWIVLDSLFLDPSNPVSTWRYDSTNPYANGTGARYGSASGYVWDIMSGDFNFIVNQEPTPTVSYNRRINYTKRYV